jgi:archaellum biogenesis ATPase FlaH
LEEALTKTLYENLLIQFLFKDEEVRDRLVPYLNPLVFSNTINSHIVGHILSFMEKHTHFPRMNELKLFIKSSEDYDRLIEIMNYDSSDFDKEFILKELEEFYRKSLLLNLQMDMKDNFHKPSEELQKYSDDIRTVLSFTFDNSIGLSLLDDRDSIFRAMHDKDTVFSSGISALDNLIDSGFHEKSLNLFLASSNMGKSLIKTSLACNFLKKNKKVLYISLEMSEQKIMERVLANVFDENINELKNMSKEKFNKKFELVKSVIKSDLKIIQLGAKTVSTNKIRSILKEYETKKRFKPDVLIVDYLGLMTTNNKSKDTNTYSELKLISEELRCLSIEYGFPIISSVQTTRNAYNSINVEITDISESIGIVNTADLLISISQNPELKEAGRYKWSILKNRYGLNSFNFYVGVNYPKMRIYDVDESQDLSQVITPKDIVDQASVEVLKNVKNNTQQARSKLTGIE